MSTYRLTLRRTRFRETGSLLLATLCYPETQFLDQRMVVYQQLAAAVTAAHAAHAGDEADMPVSGVFPEPLLSQRQEQRLAMRIQLGGAVRMLLDAMTFGQTLDDRVLLTMATARVAAEAGGQADNPALRREWNAMQPALHIAASLAAQIALRAATGREASWRHIVIDPDAALAWAEGAIHYGEVLAAAVPDIAQRIVVRMTD